MAPSAGTPAPPGATPVAAGRRRDARADRPAAQLPARGDLPNELVARIHELCGGNPFFVSETVREWFEKDAILRSHDGWVLATQAADASDLPETVREAMRLRLMGLSEKVAAGAWRRGGHRRRGRHRPVARGPARSHGDRRARRDRRCCCRAACFARRATPAESSSSTTCSASCPTPTSRPRVAAASTAASASGSNSAASKAGSSPRPSSPITSRTPRTGRRRSPTRWRRPRRPSMPTPSTTRPPT